MAVRIPIRPDRTVRSPRRSTLRIPASIGATRGTALTITREMRILIRSIKIKLYQSNLSSRRRKRILALENQPPLILRNMISGRPVSCLCSQNDRRQTARLSDKLLWKACRRLRSRVETHRPALVLAQTAHRLFLGLAFSPLGLPFVRCFSLCYGDFSEVEHDATDWQTAMEALLLVAEHDGPELFARIGIIGGHVERVFDIAERHSLGRRRKLA